MSYISINSRTIYIGHLWSISYDNVGNDRSHVSLTNGIATDWKVMEWNGMEWNGIHLRCTPTYGYINYQILLEQFR